MIRCLNLRTFSKTSFAFPETSCQGLSCYCKQRDNAIKYHHFQSLQRALLFRKPLVKDYLAIVSKEIMQLNIITFKVFNLLCLL